MKAIDKLIQMVCRRVNKIDGCCVTNNKVPKLAVIDDNGAIHYAVERDFTTSHTVYKYWMIPDDLAELDQFDVLIVDGDGIGNNQFANGVDFLVEYAPKHPDKKFVHFTGWCNNESREKLNRIGVTVVQKGCRTEELRNAILGEDGCDGK